MKDPAADTQPDDSVPGKLAFVLSGGGSLGSVQVRCLEAVLGNGIVSEMILGTSVGALNGVFLAKLPTVEGVAQLRELWLGLERSGSFQENIVRVIDKARQWTEDLLSSVEAELLRRFALP